MSPFFTIAIPSKNRPDRVGDAVRSVLEQTFSDVEVIVCDNSDPDLAGQTEALVTGLGDERVRYLRTSGTLSMPDNWERSIEEARGEYVGILTDRSVLRRDALEVVKREIDATGAPVVSWLNDLYATTGKEFKRRECTFGRYRHTGAELLDYFVHGNPKFTTKVIPKLMKAVAHRSVLEAIRASATGRVCPPVTPDFTSGFQLLAHAEFVLTIDEALYTSVGAGNGSDFRRGGALGERFVRDLGKEPHEIVDRMPSQAVFSHALVLNDLLRVRDAIPERMPGVAVDHVQYYLGCLNDYVKAAGRGGGREKDLEVLLAALRTEPPEVRTIVERAPLYVRATSADGAVTKKVRAKVGSAIAPAQDEFETVWDALAWDAANPRTPVPTTFVTLQNGVDELYGRAPKPRKPGKRRFRIPLPVIDTGLRKKAEAFLASRRS